MNSIFIKKEEPIDLILSIESEELCAKSNPVNSTDIYTVKDEPTDDDDDDDRYCNDGTQKDQRTVTNNSNDVSSKEFLKLGNKITKTKCRQKESFKIQRFKSFFGVTPHVCSIVWKQVNEQAPIDFQPRHLLWGLTFLKQYTNEHNRQSILKADEKTIRKWTWVAVDLLSTLNVIIWENRTRYSVAGQTAFCSLDSVDFKIKKPSPSNPKWYSHKFKGPALRYEIGICIRTGHLVWKNGGYPCGEYSDLRLAQQAYVLAVDVVEKTFADKRYADATYFIVPNGENKCEHDRIMVRHEAVNKRFKRFEALKQSFRHDLEKHTMVFNAVANLIQLMLENDEPLVNV